MNIDLDNEHAGHEIVKRPSASAAGLLRAAKNNELPPGDEVDTVDYCRDCERVVR